MSWRAGVEICVCLLLPILLFLLILCCFFFFLASSRSPSSGSGVWSGLHLRYTSLISPLPQTTPGSYSPPPRSSKKPLIKECSFDQVLEDLSNHAGDSHAGQHCRKRASSESALTTPYPGSNWRR